MYKVVTADGTVPGKNNPFIFIAVAFVLLYIVGTAYKICKKGT
jgi:hypothetical protein